MHWGKIAFLGLVIAVALTAFAVGAGKRSFDTVVLCAAKKSGQLTLADDGKCGKGERKVTVARGGRRVTPPVPSGPSGPPGPQGSAGAPATSPPLEERHLVSPANVNCETQPGSFCVTQSGFCFNMGNAGDGQAPVSYRKDSDGFVHLEGAFDNFNSEGACGLEARPVFYLPPGFRPAGGSLRFPVAQCSGDESGFIGIATNGRISDEAFSGNCLTLNGVVFHGAA